MKRSLSFFAVAALAVALFSSCAKKSDMGGDMGDSTKMTGANMMDANKAGTKGFYEDVFNGHNPAAVDKYCAANFVDHNPTPGHTGQGLDEMKKSFTEWFASMPDVHMTVNRISADSDFVWVMYTMTGTMKGDMGGMKATNKSAKVDGIDLIRIKDGKATDRWGYYDAMSMMMQLGLMPPPPPSGGAMQKK